MILILGIPFLRILGQKDTGNPYATLLNIILEFFVAFLFAYLSFKVFTKRKFVGNLKIDLINFIIVIFLYFVLSYYISLNISSAFSNNLEFNPKNIEFLYYVVPAVSIAFLFIFRLFNSVENTINIFGIIQIDPSEVSNISKEIIIGIFILSVIGNVFFSGGIYALSNLLDFVTIPNLLVVFFFSFIVSFLEILIFYLRKYLLAEIKDVSEPILSKDSLKNIILFGVFLLPMTIVSILAMNNPVSEFSHCFDIDVANLNSNIVESDQKIILEKSNNFEIPLIKINSSSYPMTNRISTLLSSSLINPNYENKALSINITKGFFKLNYSLPVNYTDFVNKKTEIQKPNIDFLSTNKDYDTVILYSLTINGYNNIKYFSTFTDYFFRTNEQKFFLNLNNRYNDIAVVSDLQGGIYILDNYNIIIISQNATISNSVKNILNSYDGKVKVITVDKNPHNYYPLNC